MLLEFGDDTQKRAAINKVQCLAVVGSQNRRVATRVATNPVSAHTDDNSISHTEEEDNMDSEDEE